MERKGKGRNDKGGHERIEKEEEERNTIDRRGAVRK